LERFEFGVIVDIHFVGKQEDIPDGIKNGADNGENACCLDRAHLIPGKMKFSLT